MRIKRCFAIAGLVAALGTIPAAGALAQAAGLTTEDYVRAIHAAIYSNWAPDSYSPNLVPDATCPVHIVQMPGGDVLAVDILPECSFGKEGQAAVVTAVHQSSPLPYQGFEHVYQREIRMVFHAASANDRAVSVTAAVARQHAAAVQLEEDKRWAADIAAHAPYDYYVNHCQAMLQASISKTRFQRRTDVMVTVARSGKIVSLEPTPKDKPLDKQMVDAFMAAPPCHPVPREVARGESTLRVGPVFTPNWEPDPPGVRGVCRDAKGNICDPDAALK
jgi:hypothetical protein